MFCCQLDITGIPPKGSKKPGVPCTGIPVWWGFSLELATEHHQEEIWKVGGKEKQESAEAMSKGR